jgi:putative methyltransferase
VLAYEALLGQGLPGGGGGEEGDGDVGDVGNVGNKSSKQQSRHRAGPAEDAVREGLPALRRALADLQREHGASSVLELASRLAGGSGGEGGSAAAAAAGAAKAPNDEQHQHWRSVRVNALKLPTVETALAELDKEKGGSGGASAPSSSAAALRDPLLPELLLFPPGTDLHAHPLVRSGALILQSRASCLPARALAPKPGWTVLDACAAPGNKTTHLAALVGGGAAADSKNKKQARVLAFDRDPRRLELLRRNVERAGASSIVRAERADFLALDPLAPQFAAVRAVLLDPSCSGSGTAAARQLAGGGLLSSSAGVGPTEEEEEKNAAAAEDGGAEPAADERVEQLARFQATALKHALKFPKCERVSYSTCSVYRRENEAVVAEVLADSEVAAAGWRLADPFPSMRGGGGGKSKEKAGVAPMYGRRGWPHPGLPAGQERLLVRTDAALDGTDGFFVALFVRDLGGKATTR